MHTDVAALLIDIEAELRRLGFWDAVAPSDEALASDQPFAVDTLSLPQWLQFIFLPTMYGLIEAREPLPERCGIVPMAEEYFRHQSTAATVLLETLATMDKLLSGDALDYSVQADFSN